MQEKKREIENNLLPDAKKSQVVLAEMNEELVKLYSKKKFEEFDCSDVLLHYLISHKFPSLKKIDKKMSLCVNRKIMTYSTSCVSLLRQLLQINPFARPTISSIMTNPWVNM